MFSHIIIYTNTYVLLQSLRLYFSLLYNVIILLNIVKYTQSCIYFNRTLSKIVIYCKVFKYNFFFTNKLIVDYIIIVSNRLVNGMYEYNTTYNAKNEKL